MNRDARLVGLALLLWGFGEGLFFHIQSLYMEQLGATPVQIGGLLSVANMARAATYLPAGMIADRVPRKWLMAGGWVTGLVGVLFMAVAGSWQALIPGLLIYALSAYCIPVINTYLAHAVEGRKLARTYTTVFAGYAAGGIISPAVGGWLAEATTMRLVYFASALLFAISTAAVVRVSPQPAPSPVDRKGRSRSVLNRRFIRFGVLTGLVFTAMYVSFPLAPNYLKDVGAWRVNRIGALGSFQALGTTLLNPFLGRLGDREEDANAPDSRVMRWGWGLTVGPVLVWVSIVILLLANSFPMLGAAFLLSGAYQGCRSLTQAKATRLGDEADRGLLLGATETLIGGAQVLAPYVAGWLYASDPAYPFLCALLFIPAVLLMAIFGSRA